MAMATVMVMVMATVMAMVMEVMASMAITEEEKRISQRNDKEE